MFIYCIFTIQTRTLIYLWHPKFFHWCSRSKVWHPSLLHRINPCAWKQHGFAAQWIKGALQFFVTLFGMLSTDPFQGLSDLQLGDKKGHFEPPGGWNFAICSHWQQSEQCFWNQVLGWFLKENVSPAFCRDTIIRRPAIANQYDGMSTRFWTFWSPEVTPPLTWKKKRPEVPQGFSGKFSCLDVDVVPCSGQTAQLLTVEQALNGTLFEHLCCLCNWAHRLMLLPTGNLAQWWFENSY